MSVDGQGLSLGGSNQAESAENAAGEPAANDSQAQAAEDADSESEEVDVEAVEASRFGSFLLGNVGSVSEDRAGGDYELRSRGITLGADYRVNKAIVVGLAVGGMRGGAESTNSEQDSRGYSVSSFVQWLPSQQWYVSGIFSSGKNNYETERFVSRGETLVPVRLRSEGNSTQNALLLESGYSLARKNLRFTPFVRYEFIRANIDALRESGGPGALLIADYQTQVSSLQAGLQTDWLINSRAGVFLPGLRVEFRKENDQRDQINARLIDSAFGIVKVRDNLVVDDFYGNAGLNLQWITGIRGQAVNFYFGLDYLFARAGFSGQNISLGAKIPF